MSSLPSLAGSPLRAASRPSLRALSFAPALACLVAAGGGCKPEEPAATWTTPVTGLGPILVSVWGTGPDDVWAVGGTCNLPTCAVTSESLVVHYDGTAWTKLDPGVKVVLWWVTGFSKNDVWLSGEQGTVLHWDGAKFTRVADGVAGADDKLYGIWGSSPNDLWVAGGRPDISSVVLRFDGKDWRKEAAAPPAGDGQVGGTWFKVWGSSGSDVWLVGQRASIVHWDGAKFTKIDLAPLGLSRQGLFTAAGRSADDVWAVGGDPAAGLALHWDGKAWSRPDGLDLSQTQLLMGVSADAAGDVALVGMGGAKFVRPAGGAWRDDSAVAPFADLHAAWMTGPEDVFAVGGSFFSLSKGIVAHYGQPISSTVK